MEEHSEEFDKFNPLSIIMQNKGLLIGIVISMFSMIFAVYFFTKAQSLSLQVKTAQNTTQQLKDDLQRIEDEKARLLKENEKAQSDAVSVLSSNTDLEKKNIELSVKLQSVQSDLEKKEEELKAKKAQMDKLNADKAKTQSPEYDKLVKEKQELDNKIKALQSDLQGERAVFHYNLGVAYSQAKLYDEAIEAYEKSLSYNPDNAEACYNLGVLYNDYKYDADKAKENFIRYLELIPDAEDKEEVILLIDKLK
ncbi:MAG: tetratricopeptide repeat protein [Candidatus Omnitrophota bacterium]